MAIACDTSPYLALRHGGMLSQGQTIDVLVVLKPPVNQGEEIKRTEQRSLIYPFTMMW